MKKKIYVTPECTTIVVHTMPLCYSTPKGEGIAEKNSGGWSNEFVGGIIDDTETSSLWEEEK